MTARPRQQQQQRLRRLRLVGAASLAFVGSVVLLQSSSSRDGFLRASPSSSSVVSRHLLSSTPADPASASKEETKTLDPSYFSTVRPYSTKTIIDTQRQFVDDKHANVLIFDGKTGTFRVYRPPFFGTWRPRSPAFLLASALQAHHPDRFQQGQPDMQLLFSHADYLEIKCLRPKDGDDAEFTDACLEEGEDFAPIMAFTSVPKNYDVIFGNAIQPMPFYKFLDCFFDVHFQDETASSQVNGCHPRPELPESDLNRSWDELKPQIFWRGTDNVFLGSYGVPYQGLATPGMLPGVDSIHSTADTIRSLRDNWNKLGPRARALAMSLEARFEGKDLGEEYTGKESAWIDAMSQKPEWYGSFYKPFYGTATTAYTDVADQATYRYHIDIGGGGGTSWSATINNLYLPGLLFHHETLTKDFFYDEMKPYVHYVPVKQDLSDLKEKFDWAESHPAEAEKISKAATELAIRLTSPEYFQQLYDGLFVQQLGKVVDAYESEEGATVESILAAYEEAGVPLIDMGECDVSANEMNMNTACEWKM